MKSIEVASLRTAVAAFRPVRGKFVLVMAVALLDAIFASLGIGMILPVFETILQPDQKSEIMGRFLPFMDDLSSDMRIALIAGATVAVFSIKAVAGIAKAGLVRDLAETMRVRWIKALGERYLYGCFRDLAGIRQGSMLNDWTNETLAGSRFCQAYLAHLTMVLQSAALMAVAFMVDWRAMAVLISVSALVLFFLRQSTFGRAISFSESKLNLHRDLGALENEALGNLRELKLLGAEQPRLREIGRTADRLKSVFVRISILSEMPRAIGEFVGVAALMGFVVGAIVVFDQQPQDVLPMMGFFLIAFYRLLMTASTAISSRMKALNELHSVLQLERFINEPARREPREGGLPVDRLETDIRFEAVVYGYGNGAVLHRVSFVIPRGHLTFLVGGSGAGKSTVLDLLMRLDEPEQGHILANGRPISAYNLIAWRRLLGYVSQETALFNGTLRANLLLARSEASNEELEEACRLAGAHDFIQHLPQGYETPVGDRGFSLSGGQRKRVAIARALLAKPEILILDEATTSFEETLEREMVAGLRKYRPDLTIIQVTHRLQTADGADHVIALQDGRVALTGKWPEVAALCAAVEH